MAKLKDFLGSAKFGNIALKIRYKKGQFPMLIGYAFFGPRTEFLKRNHRVNGESFSRIKKHTQSPAWRGLPYFPRVYQEA